jgi:hypothetical protein
MNEAIIEGTDVTLFGIHVHGGVPSTGSSPKRPDSPPTRSATTSFWMARLYNAPSCRCLCPAKLRMKALQGKRLCSHVAKHSSGLSEFSAS